MVNDKRAERMLDFTRAAALYNAGGTIRQVGAELGYPYGSARRLLLDAGVTLRRRGATNTARGAALGRRPTGQLEDCPHARHCECGDVCESREVNGQP